MKNLLIIIGLALLASCGSGSQSVGVDKNGKPFVNRLEILDHHDKIDMIVNSECTVTSFPTNLNLISDIDPDRIEEDDMTGISVDLGYGSLRETWRLETWGTSYHVSQSTTYRGLTMSIAGSENINEAGDSDSILSLSTSKHEFRGNIHVYDNGDVTVHVWRATIHTTENSYMPMDIMEESDRPVITLNCSK